MIWTSELKDRVARLLGEGLSASQIAAKIEGASRNAVVGVVHRDQRLREIGFARRSGWQNIEKAKDMSVAVKRRRGGKVSLSRLKIAPVPPIVADAEPDSADQFGAPQVAGMPLMMLQPHHCRWCINDPEPGANGHLFCGEVKDRDRAYCAFHATLSVGKGTESERTSVRSALRIAA